ncbi:MAG: GNAT family N-acetyltransferase [Alphaproteobacteria bacterium]|nr:GNAT family N-acetyltransferase [Alphaproteobacteria bacterium]
MKEFLPISTDRLIIRSFRLEDAAAFHGWRNDADVARYTLWEFPYPMAEAEKISAEMASKPPFPEGEWYQLIIEDRASGNAVGDIGIGNGVTPEGAGVVSVGYSLSRVAQGKGYMTEVLAALLPTLIVPLKVTKFIAEIDVRNPASGRVLEKAGFVRGQLHEKRSFVKGEWCDEIDFTLDATSLATDSKE